MLTHLRLFCPPLFFPGIWLWQLKPQQPSRMVSWPIGWEPVLRTMEEKDRRNLVSWGQRRWPWIATSVFLSRRDKMISFLFLPLIFWGFCWLHVTHLNRTNLGDGMIKGGDRNRKVEREKEDKTYGVRLRLQNQVKEINLPLFWISSSSFIGSSYPTMGQSLITATSESAPSCVELPLSFPEWGLCAEWDAVLSPPPPCHLLTRPDIPGGGAAGRSISSSETAGPLFSSRGITQARGILGSLPRPWILPRGRNSPLFRFSESTQGSCHFPTPLWWGGQEGPPSEPPSLSLWFWHVQATGTLEAAVGTKQTRQSLSFTLYNAKF